MGAVKYNRYQESKKVMKTVNNQTIMEKSIKT